VLCEKLSAQEIGREAMRQHDRLGAAIGRRGEQFERAAALALAGATVLNFRLGHEDLVGGATGPW
jgi:hypothetical protein